MPSDLPLHSAGPPTSRWSWLSSQGLGVLCGQATVLLLAVDSIVLAATRDGISVSCERCVTKASVSPLPSVPGLAPNALPQGPPGPL